MKRLVIIACLILAWVLSASAAGAAETQWLPWDSTPHAGTLDLARYWQAHEQACGQPNGPQRWTGRGAVQSFARCSLHSTITLEPRMAWSIFQKSAAEIDANSGTQLQSTGYTSRFIAGNLVILFSIVRKAAASVTTTNVTDSLGDTYTKLFEVGTGSGANALSAWWARVGSASQTLSFTTTASTTGANMAFTAYDFNSPANAPWTIQSDANFPNDGTVSSSASIPVAGNSSSAATYSQTLAMYGIGTSTTNQGSSSDSNAGYTNQFQNNGVSNSLSLATAAFLSASAGDDLSDTVTMTSSGNWRWGFVVAYATIPNNTPLLVTRQAGVRASVW